LVLLTCLLSVSCFCRRDVVFLQTIVCVVPLDLLVSHSLFPATLTYPTREPHSLPRFDSTIHINMFSSTSCGLSLAVLITSVSAAFSPSAKNNVAVYWGQGSNQLPLLETCKNSAVDIVNIGFVNAFPDNSPGAYPGTNFGNACGDETYAVNGVSTLLKSSCPRIGSDIIECQKTYGKKIFLSFGGDYPKTYYIANDNSANSFADFVWGAFGPSTSAWTTAGKPRPFGDAVVDGFDFDIESNMTAAPKDPSGNLIDDYQSRGYATMINRLKNIQFPKDTSKSYYISGAPQCPLPDVHLSGPIANAWFDMLFVQFYNNPSCSGRAAINYAAGDSFLHWTQAASKNPDVKIYFGLPASTKAASASDYLTQPEVKDIVQRFSPNAKWGGIMLWESTYAQNNTVCGKDYTTWSKNIVTAVTSGQTIDTDISKCSSLPSPIQSGVISTCNRYEKTNSGGAKCDKFATRIGVSLAQLYAWNSILGPNGEYCGSKFVGDTYYCVGVNPPPGATQDGITPYCTKYEKANAGGSCPVFANRVGISTSNLYAWNSVLGNNGQNCAGQFWGNTYYCVGVSPNYVAPAQPTPTGAAPAPGPTQSGIISTCSKYLMANKGGTCPVFANRAGITTAQLYAWNTVLGNNGQNCAGQFWGNTYYCVGVRSSKARRDVAAEITAYGSTPAAYEAAPSAYGAVSLTASSEPIVVTTLEPYMSTSKTPATYVSVPTQSPIVPANTTLIIIGTTRVVTVPYPTSVGTASGYVHSNNTVVATGTSASKPATTSALVHPYTGAGRKTEVSFGLAAVFVGLSVWFM
jgi:chitinase